MDVTEFNRNAWNLQSLEGCRWSTPHPPEIIERARRGEWDVILTPNRPVPRPWFPGHPDLGGMSILGLASGGGQQIPIFAAAGASVTSYDASDVQLQKDEETCRRHGLDVTIVQGDMADLSAFDSGTFDLIFHPVSNVFAPSLDTVWRECHRVLRPGGRLLSGFMNPCFFLFDHYEAERTGEWTIRFRLPYSDLDGLSEKALADHLGAQVSLEFSHSWEEQIGGQCAAGLSIRGFYEDGWDDESSGLNRWMPLFAATLAVKDGETRGVLQAPNRREKTGKSSG